MTDCPSVEDLRCFVRGEAPDALAITLEAHVSDCPACQTRSALIEADRADEKTTAVQREGESRFIRNLLDRLRTPAPPLGPPTAEWIGPYRVLGRLGRGGMGEVFAAVDRRLNRRVALKLLRPGLDDPEALARFRREAELLAQVRHPNVVAVHEIGEHDGAVYLVLEYLAGGTLAARLTGRALPPRAAAAVLATIADGVAAAHRAGIIHRDLKPANVLLQPAETANAAEPLDGAIPKVADFGLARLTHPGAGLTQTGVVIGTPAYMAPEQAAGRPMGAEGDVFALGILLYELLTGRLPFVADDVGQLLIMIQTLDPPAPRRLQPGLPRDLETICLKCLEKEPARRYPNAGELHADLQRFLAHRPVRARPLGWIGRARRWVRRNPIVAALALLTTLALVGGVVGVGLFALRAAEQRDRANDATARAQAKADEATALNQLLLEDLLNQASSKAQSEQRFAPTPDLTLREALDRAAAKVAERFADKPLLEARVRTVLAETYFDLGRNTEATAQAEAALAVLAAHLPINHPACLAARAHRATVWLQAGRLAEAVPELEACLAARRAVLGATHPDTLQLQHDLARAYLNVARPMEALTLLEACLAAQRAELGATHPATLLTLSGLATAYLQVGRVDAAVSAYQECLRERRAKFGAEHPDTLLTVVNFAAALGARGQTTEMIELYRAHLPMLQKVLGPTHPTTLGVTVNLGTVLAKAQRFREALSLLEPCLPAVRQVLGARHPQTLQTLNSLAMTYRDNQRAAEALPLLEECLRTRREVLGPSHPDTLETMNNLAVVYRELGRPAEAVPLFAEALKLSQAQLGPHHPDTLLRMHNLAGMLFGLGRTQEGLALWQERLRLVRAHYPPGDPAEKWAVEALVGPLVFARQFEQAERVLLDTHERWSELPARYDCRRLLALYYYRCQQPHESAKWLALAYEEAERLPPPRSAP
jgi:tetratricopeptide (TPR) repeat protein